MAVQPLWLCTPPCPSRELQGHPTCESGLLQALNWPSCTSLLPGLASAPPFQRTCVPPSPGRMKPKELSRAHWCPNQGGPCDLGLHHRGCQGTQLLLRETSGREMGQALDSATKRQRTKDGRQSTQHSSIPPNSCCLRAAFFHDLPSDTRGLSKGPRPFEQTRAA